MFLTFIFIFVPFFSLQFFFFLMLKVVLDSNIMYSVVQKLDVSLRTFQNWGNTNGKEQVRHKCMAKMFFFSSAVISCKNAD